MGSIFPMEVKDLGAKSTAAQNNSLIQIPSQFKDVDANSFYRYVNKCEPSLIRIDADELTYCLHTYSFSSSRFINIAVQQAPNPRFQIGKMIPHGICICVVKAKRPLAIE
ncbi:MAG: hypothetical protein KBA53_05190 [Thermoclostridium sp.]|nr:hypothetical protein [Thermoclostridium sp.]